MRKHATLAGLLVFGLACASFDEARAAESAAGIYLLGAKGSMAGYVPPPAPT
jgi:hypothetical protein